MCLLTDLSHTCCFLGHRTICETEELKIQLRNTIETLIENYGVTTFLFGSKSRFNNLCYEITSEIKKKYNYIQRIYVRAEFPEIEEDYEKYLLEFYEYTYFPESALNAGKAVYIKRNREMIDKSRFCVFYYSKALEPTKRTSGTKIAYDYAVHKKRKIYSMSLCR